MTDGTGIDDGAGRSRSRRLRGLSATALGVSVVASGLIAGATPTAAANGCDQGRQAGPGRHEYLLVCSQVPFAQAKAAADKAGGHLVTIGSGEESAFVADLIDVPGAWTAGNIDTVTGPWLGLIQDPGGPEPTGGWG